MGNNPEKGDMFKDNYGDVWVYIGHNNVRRLRDNNIGGYYEGRGLESYRPSPNAKGDK